MKFIFFLRKENGGQSLVETAILIPIILFIIFGIIAFGMIFNASLVVSSASREGARAAAVGKSDSEVIKLVSDKVNVIPKGKLADEPKITPKDSSRILGEQVKVEVEYNVDISWIPLIGSIVGNEVPLKSSTIMRVERQSGGI